MFVFVCVCFLVWAIMSRMLFVYVLFVCVFLSFIYTYCTFEILLNHLFIFLCSIWRTRLKLILYNMFVSWFELCFPLCFFSFFFFVYLHCTSCYSVMARIYKQETSNYQSIYCSFLFLFSRSMPSRHSTTVTTTQVSKKVCDRRAFKVLRYHYY